MRECVRCEEELVERKFLGDSPICRQCVKYAFRAKQKPLALKDRDGTVEATRRAVRESVQHHRDTARDIKPPRIYTMHMRGNGRG